MRKFGIESSSTINSANDAQDITAHEAITTLDDLFDMTLHQKEPQMSWIPKLHKTSYKARFIAGSRTCTTTKLSKLITNCLKLVKSYCNVYCKTIVERTRSWTISNSLEVFVLRTLEEKH